MMEGLHLKGRPRAARVALKTPKLSRKPRTVAMIKNADTAKRLSLHAQISFHAGEWAAAMSTAQSCCRHISAEARSSSAMVMKAATAEHLYLPSFSLAHTAELELQMLACNGTCSRAPELVRKQPLGAA